MRMSLTGKQARLEGEPHFQDEHVAETDMVNRLLVNSRLPIIMNIPTVVNRVWEQTRKKKEKKKGINTPFLAPYNIVVVMGKGRLKVFTTLSMSSKRDASR
jgi:hypothetical protein